MALGSKFVYACLGFLQHVGVLARNQHYARASMPILAPELLDNVEMPIGTSITIGVVEEPGYG